MGRTHKDTDQSKSEDGSREQSTVGPSTTSRRVALGLLGGLGGIGLLSGQVSAKKDQQPWNQWDSDVNAHGHDLDNLGSIGMDGNPNSISDFEGDNLSISDGVLHAAESHCTLDGLAEGHIVTIGRGLNSENNSIDPEEHDQPIQTAINQVADSVADSDGQGKVILPPNTTIKEATTVQAKRGVSILGLSAETSVIHIQKNGVPGLDVSGARYAHFDQFELRGPDMEDTGPAITIQEDASSSEIHFGRLRVYNWGNAVFKNKGKLWASRFDHIRSGKVDHAAGGARAMFDIDESGPALRFGLLHLYPNCSISKENQDIFYISSSGPIYIEQMNLGNHLGRVLVHGSGYSTRSVTIDTVNYEPSGFEQFGNERPGGLPGELFKLNSRGTTIRVNSLYIGDYGIRDLYDEYPWYPPVAEYIYRLEDGEGRMGERGEGNNFLVPPESQGMKNVKNNIVNVAGDLGPRPTFYFGMRDEVDVTTGSANGKLRILGEGPAIGDGG